MNRRRALVIIALTAAIALPLAVSGRRLADARAAYAASQSMFLVTAREAQEIIDLRAKAQRVDDRQRPEAHVLSQVNAVLAEAGIAGRRLESLRPEADVAVAGSNASYRRQSVRLNFQQLRLTELGSFLSRWRAAQQIWKPRRIEITKRRTTATDDRYDVTILISALYLAQGRDQ